MTAHAWRGRAADLDADRTAAESGDPAAVARLRVRSRALLGSLVRPHRRALAATIVLLLLQSAAGMAGPFLVMLAIDKGIPPLRQGDPTILIEVGLAFVAAVAWPNTSASGASCACPPGSARTCCATCGNGSTTTSSGCRSASTSATRRAGWWPG